MKKTLALLVFTIMLNKEINSQTFTWSALASGLTGTSYSIAVSGTNIYYGGNFTITGTGYKGIALWNGTAWSTLGHGISSLRDWPNDWSETVNSCAVGGSNVYIGGNFKDAVNGNDTYDEANGIAMWNGTSWVDMGSGLSTGFINPTTPTVYAILIIGSDVYIAGEFQKVNGVTVNSIAKWNGSAWSALGKGVTAGSQQISCLATDGTYLYIGGNFTQVTNGDNSTVSVNNIARWNLSNSTWSSVAKGVDNGVSSIDVNVSDIYLVGGFSNATNSDDSVVPVNGIVKWNGTSWSSVGDNSNLGSLTDIEIFGNNIYLASAYWNSTAYEYRVKKWNGSSYVSCGGNANSNINSLKISSTYNAIFAGGSFTTVNGSTSAIGAAKFTDSDNPLPVELTSLFATLLNRNVTLTWQTATETNNYGFNVERITENESWTKIGFVQGNGNSNSTKTYTFTDKNAPNGKLQYRLKQIDFDGKFEYSSIVEVNVDALNRLELNQNYPNPFNPVTTISYNLPNITKVNLVVYDVTGREVATLVNEFQSAGKHQINFNATKIASGVYYYRIQAGDIIQTKKMLLIK